MITASTGGLGVGPLVDVGCSRSTVARSCMGERVGSAGSVRLTQAFEVVLEQRFVVRAGRSTSPAHGKALATATGSATTPRAPPPAAPVGPTHWPARCWWPWLPLPSDGGSNHRQAASRGGYALTEASFWLQATVNDKRWDAPYRPVVTVGSWPLPGFPGGCRKLTLAGRAIASRVRFLASPRTHSHWRLGTVAHDRLVRWQALKSASRCSVSWSLDSAAWRGRRLGSTRPRVERTSRSWWLRQSRVGRRSPPPAAACAPAGAWPRGPGGR